MNIGKVALLTSLSAFALASGSALAADMGPPAKAPLAAPALLPVINWTGCYLNGGGGYGMYNQDHYVMDNGVTDFQAVTSGGSGWLGTVGGGCDVQWGNFVAGALIDYDFMDIHGTFSDPDLVGFIGTEKENSAWGAGGRIGYLVTPAILTYINGGYTASRFGGFTLSSPFLSDTFSFPSHTYSGGFIGGGTEIAMQQWWPGLFWRSEYRYSTSSCDNLQASVDGFPLSGVSLHSCKNVQTITSSLVWKFNWTH
jgi:outer membrane immunogenic protein